MTDVMKVWTRAAAVGPDRETDPSARTKETVTKLVIWWIVGGKEKTGVKEESIYIPSRKTVDMVYHKVINKTHLSFVHAPSLAMFSSLLDIFQLLTLSFYSSVFCWPAVG